MGHRLFILRANHRGGTAWPGRASLRVSFKNIEVALSLSSVNRQEGRFQLVLLLTDFTPMSLSFRVGVIRVSADQGIAGEIRWGGDRVYRRGRFITKLFSTRGTLR